MNFRSVIFASGLASGLIANRTALAIDAPLDSGPPPALTAAFNSISGAKDLAGLLALLGLGFVGGLTLNGSRLVIRGSGGIPGWTYFVLAKTNLSLPNWTPVATNQFDVNGNFNWTNAVNPANSQSFYLLQLP